MVLQDQVMKMGLGGWLGCVTEPTEDFFLKLKDSLIFKNKK